MDAPIEPFRALIESNSSVLTEADRAIWFEQYKLAVDMAAQISSKRQDANKFYISLVSIFGILQKLLPSSFHNSSPSLTPGVWQTMLPLLGACWCCVWWLTILRYRRINQAKWAVIYELEAILPSKPFISEKAELRRMATKKTAETDNRGSFALTQLELTIPIFVGFTFLLLAILPLILNRNI